MGALSLVRVAGAAAPAWRKYSRPPQPGGFEWEGVRFTALQVQCIRELVLAPVSTPRGSTVAVTVRKVRLATGREDLKPVQLFCWFAYLTGLERL